MNGLGNIKEGELIFLTWDFGIKNTDNLSPFEMQIGVVSNIIGKNTPTYVSLENPIKYVCRFQGKFKIEGPIIDKYSSPIGIANKEGVEVYTPELLVDKLNEENIENFKINSLREELSKYLEENFQLEVKNNINNFEYQTTSNQ